MNQRLMVELCNVIVIQRCANGIDGILIQVGMNLLFQFTVCLLICETAAGGSSVEYFNSSGQRWLGFWTVAV